MNYRKWLGLVLLVVLPFVLAACGGDDGDDGDNGDNGGADASDVELSESITAEEPEMGISLTVSYPEGWVAQSETGVILVANTQDMMDMAQQSGSETPEIDADQVFLSVQPLPSEFLSFMLEEGEEETAAAVIGSVFVGTLSEGFEVGEVEELTVGGNDAAAVAATSADEGRIYAVAVELEGGFVAVSAVSASDEEDFDDEVLAIAGSVEATFPEVPGGDDMDEGEEAPEATEEG